MDKNDIIIEPSAGNGAFIREIKSISRNFKFYDLIPEHIDIVQQDFLTIDTSDFKHFKFPFIWPVVNANKKNEIVLK